MDNMFFDNDPIQEAPFLELPNFQEGSLPCRPPRNDYSLLEPLRPFLFQNYDPYMWVIPRTSILNAQVPTGVLPGQQIEDRIQLPKGCWILGFAAHASGIGFRWQIWDEGAQDYAMSDRWLQGTDVDTDTTDGATPCILPDPYLVVSPGRLQVRVTNLDNTAIQNFNLLIHIAVPRKQVQG